MDVVVLPSAAPGLVTARTWRFLFFRKLSTTWRSMRYRSAASECGASRLTRCSSRRSAAGRRGSRDARVIRWGVGAGKAGGRALVDGAGSPWARSRSACSSALENLLMPTRAASSVIRDRSGRHRGCTPADLEGGVEMQGVLVVLLRTHGHLPAKSTDTATSIGCIQCRNLEPDNWGSP